MENLNVNEAIKRIRQETCPATYMQDFDKEECLKVIEDSIKQKDDTIQALKEYLIKWDDMLQLDGVNSKSMVNGYPKAVNSNIISCIKGKRHIAYGFTYRYLEV